MVKIYNFQRDFDLIVEEIDKLKESYIQLPHLKVWNDWFGGIQRGSVQMVAAASGQGKTTFLIAAAKEAVEKGLKVLYVSTEQTAATLYEDIGVIDLDFVRGNYIELKQVIAQDPTYDVIVYDYIGADGSLTTDSEWRELRDQADALSNIAIDYHIAIITAAQADYSILEYKSVDEIPNNNKHISFARHIVDKVSAAAYLIKKDGSTYLKMIKNRYMPFRPKAEKIQLLYDTKTFTSMV